MSYNYLSSYLLARAWFNKEKLDEKSKSLVKVVKYATIFILIACIMASYYFIQKLLLPIFLSLELTSYTNFPTIVEYNQLLNDARYFTWVTELIEILLLLMFSIIAIMIWKLLTNFDVPRNHCSILTKIIFTGSSIAIKIYFRSTIYKTYELS